MRTLPALALCVLVGSMIPVFAKETPGDHDETVNTGGFYRSYTIHVPPGYHHGTPLPVVIVFHGAGGSGRHILHYAGWDKKADASGFLVVAPDAVLLNASIPESDTNPTVWQETPEDTGTVVSLNRDATGRDTVNDIGFVEALLDDLPHRYSVDTKRIYATGFSNGAGFTWRLASLLSTRFAACAPVSGLFGGMPARPQRLMPVLFVIGLDDEVFPFRGGYIDQDGQKVARPPVLGTVVAWAAAAGLPPGFTVRQQHTFPVTADGISILDYGAERGPQKTTVYLIAGMKHEWPKTTQFQADDVLWDFFQQHSLP